MDVLTEKAGPQNFVQAIKQQDQINRDHVSKIQALRDANKRRVARVRRKTRLLSRFKDTKIQLKKLRGRPEEKTVADVIQLVDKFSSDADRIDRILERMYANGEKVANENELFSKSILKYMHQIQYLKSSLAPGLGGSDTLYVPGNENVDGTPLSVLF